MIEIRYGEKLFCLHSEFFDRFQYNLYYHSYFLIQIERTKDITGVTIQKYSKETDETGVYQVMRPMFM